ncbi:MAG TPA: AvaI/BsoBI family type II restriction endonuclease [Pyrinomonadaceae bacterium]|nr:AvaI/BsoBI family type II restriction endonuclease [Pyrinomonadaceae bacterium]
MAKPKPYRLHLKSSDNLVTCYEDTRAGFVELALEKNRRATPFIEQARALKVAASGATRPSELIEIEGIHSALLTAAGVSDKATKYLRSEDKSAAIQILIEKFLEPAGSNFVEELVYRFLLTRGDTLGGSMRNVGGVLAERKLSRALISTLALAGISYLWLPKTNKNKNIWMPVPDEDSDIELHLSGLSWGTGKKQRTVRFNLTVPFIKNNIDLCLLACRPDDLQAAIRSPAAYIALGELKGGIDPGGADEHGGKTAKAALDRIRRAFEPYEKKPHTFFIAAAIAKKMAGEIWAELEAGTLDNAANLTNDDQVASLSRWLCGL